MSARLDAVLWSAARAAGPPLLFGLRLWVSVCLALYIAFWLQLDNAYWAATTAAIVCQPQLGASLRKGWFRMIGTLIGAVAIVVLTALFPQARVPFLVGLALWGAACALAATVLRNFASYAAALAGYTAAIIAADELGATGGPDANAVFLLAVYPRQRNLPRHRLRRCRPRRFRSRRRQSQARCPIGGAIGGSFRPISRHAGRGGTGHAGDDALPDASWSDASSPSILSSMLRKENPLELRYHSPVLQRRSMVYFPPWPAGARSLCCWRGFRTTRRGARPKPSWKTFRGACDRPRAACRWTGWPTPSCIAAPARRRLARWSRRAPPRHRCGYSPIRRRKS